MQSVSPAFLAAFSNPAQAPRWRIEWLVSSGFNFPAGVSAAVTATTTKNTYRGSGVTDSRFAASNLCDGQSSEPIKYAICDHAACKTDSGFCCLGEGAKYTPGWWSEARSDTDGDFAVPPEVEVVYSAAIDANRIRVTTTKTYSGTHTVNVQVRYQGSDIYTDLGDYAFGTGTRIVADLGAIKQIARIKILVKKTKAGEDYARLLEIEPVLEWSSETLGSLEDYCDSVSITKSSGAASSYSPAAPGYGTNSLAIALSKEAPIVPEENQIVLPYYGYGDELLPQGVFVVSEVKEEVDHWQVTAHSVLSLAAYHRYPDTVWESVKMSTITGRLLEWVGITEDNIAYNLASDPIWEWYVVEGGACDQALATAADKLGVAIYEDEIGKVQVRSSYGASVLTITDDMIATISQTKPHEVNCVLVYYGNIRRGAEDYVLQGQAELGASETKTLLFRYSKSPCLDMRPPVITEFKDSNNQPLALPTILDWAADAYSLTATVRNNTATAGTLRIQVWGVPLEKSSTEAVYEAKDAGSIRRRGVRPHEVRLYTNNSTRAKAYGDQLLKYLQACAGALDLTLDRPAPHLQLRDVVRVQSNTLGINADYVVTEIELADDTRLNLIPKAAVV